MPPPTPPDAAPAPGTRVLIEGPAWAGMWTEIVADAVRAVGGTTAVHYHNVKPPAWRLLGGLLRGLKGLGVREPQAYRRGLTADSNRRLAGLARAFRPDRLISIQGRIDRDTVALFKGINPDLEITYWWGDILTDEGRRRVGTVAGAVDRVLYTYRGDAEALKALGVPNLTYFPFGVSPSFHTPGPITDDDRRRYASEVSLVGTGYPERAEVARELGRRLGRPVRVWGRGWKAARGVEWGGSLTLPESLKVHALSKICLNLHHTGTRDGLNMKTYEIPAAGGFELCDFQPVLAETSLGRHVPTYRNPDELAERVAHYLAHADQRTETARRAHAAALADHLYTDALAALLGAPFRA